MRLATATVALFGSVLASAVLAQTTTVPPRSNPAPAVSGVNPGTATAPGTGTIEKHQRPVRPP